MNSVTKISRIDVNFGEYDVAKWITMWGNSIGMAKSLSLWKGYLTMTYEAPHVIVSLIVVSKTSCKFAMGWKKKIFL